MSAFIFPLITFPYVSRVLCPEGTGKVAFAASIAAYFAMFAQLGIPTYGIRACAQVRDDADKLSKTVREIFIINMIMTVLSYIIFGIFLMTVPQMHAEKKLFLVVGTTMLFNTVGMDWLYKGLEQYSYVTIRAVFFKAVAVVLMLLLVRSRDDYVVYGAITVFASSAANLLNFFHVRKLIVRKRFDKYDLRRHLGPIFVFFAMSCATTVYTNLDTVMLGFMKSDADVGYYNVVIRIKNVLLGLVTSLGAVLLPRASYYIEHGLHEAFRQISDKAISFVLLISLPIAVFFMSFAKETVLFMAGAAYEPAVVPMLFIMPTIVLIGLTNIMGMQMLVPLGMEKNVLMSEIAGATVDLVLNLLLIPRMASTGAAIGTLAAEAVVFAVQYRSLHQYMSSNNLTEGMKMLTAAIAAAIAAIAAGHLCTSTFLIVASGAAVFGIVYLGILFALKQPMLCEITDIVIGKLAARSAGRHNGG